MNRQTTADLPTVNSVGPVADTLEPHGPERRQNPQRNRRAPV